MTKKKERPVYQYNICVEVEYWATEYGDFTKWAENKEEAENLAIQDAKEFITNNGQIVGCQGYSEGDFKIYSSNRTDGTIEDD